MTYDSSKVDQRQVETFNRLLIEHLEGFWSSGILFAYAAALEETAPLVRQKAVDAATNEAAKNQVS
jgi:hypothetical protein